MDLKTKVMQFLYKWTTEGKIPHIRKGMVEELEAFITDEQAKLEAERAAESMMAQQEVAKQEQA